MVLFLTPSRNARGFFWLGPVFLMQVIILIKIFEPALSIVASVTNTFVLLNKMNQFITM
jgi:hypothetical protein